MPLSALIRNCEFKFKCDQSWDSMTTVSGYKSECVRYCKKCHKNVYWVGHDDELLMHIEFNHCVAISFDISNVKKFLDVPLVGSLKNNGGAL